MKWIICLLGVVLCGAEPTTEPANADASATSINSAKILLRNRDFAGARVMLNRVTDSDQLYPQSLFLLGQCDEGEGNISGAIAKYSQVVVIAKADDVKEQAQAAMDALNEGKKILLRYADQLDHDSLRYKNSNRLAYETLTTAAESLRKQADSSFEMKPHHVPQVIPSDAVEFQGHRYAVIKTQMTWHMAKTKCEEMGGYLVCIETKEENDFLGSTFPLHDYWIGLTCEAKPRQWQWVNGAPFTFKNWAKSQPDNFGGAENFAELFSESYPRWNDDSDHPFHRPSGGPVWFICEWGD
jgi:Lectin C-type domain